MEEITLEVETVTPLFIAGADQRNIENEGLRAPSLRGLLKWWFRASLGGAKLSSGIKDMKEIKDEENKIWGTTDKQSKVVIRTSSFSETLKISSLSFRGRGIRYLGYGLSDRKCILGKFISEVKGQNYQKDYRAYVRRASALILSNGLGNALAFWKSKDGEAYAKLYEHVNSCFRERHPAEEDILTWIISDNTSSLEVFKETKEVLALLNWMKRFAEAELEE